MSSPDNSKFLLFYLYVEYDTLCMQVFKTKTKEL